MDMKRNGWIFIIVVVLVIPLAARVACTGMVSDEELTTTEAESTTDSEAADDDSGEAANAGTEEDGSGSNDSTAGNSTSASENGSVSATVVSREVGTSIETETTEEPTYGRPVERPVEK